MLAAADMAPQMVGRSRLHVVRDGHYKCLGLGVVSLCPAHAQAYIV
jgi:hypothetical protein